MLGWQPRTELKAGLTRTIAYFDKLLSQRGPEARHPAQDAGSPPGVRRR